MAQPFFSETDGSVDRDGQEILDAQAVSGTKLMIADPR